LESFLRFNTRYEKHVCEKALDGTMSICSNHISLLQIYRTKLGTVRDQTTNATMRNVFESDMHSCNILIAALESAIETAEIYRTGWEPWIDGPGKLWHLLEETWDILERLTKQTSLLEPQLEALKRTAGFIK
jgi:hypothetical protein